MNGPARYSAHEFERESRYIENLIWDALVVESGSKVLFCGFGEDGRWVKRAIEAGAAVSVIEHRDEVIRRFEQTGATVLRGSTSVIPAATNAFDLAISFHYLHETDPFFHGQIVSELARVAQRVAIVEPGPPADRIGKKIARLYSLAKRELGQFEYYQPLEYWRNLLKSAKADISQHVFAFAKIPPLDYLRDTIDLLLATMKVEDAPQSDLDELREMARRSDSLLLPPARFVLVGAAAGKLPQPIFTPREEPTPTPEIARAAQSAEPVPAIPAPVMPAPPPPLPEPIGFNAPPAPPEFAPAPGFAPTPGFEPIPPETPPGFAPPPSAAPFAMPGTPEMPAPPPSFGLPWQWEPPDAGGQKPG